MGTEEILALVTQDMDLVSAGGYTAFLARNQEEQERLALLLARILGGVIHDLENGVYVIVRH